MTVLNKRLSLPGLFPCLSNTVTSVCELQSSEGERQWDCHQIVDLEEDSGEVWVILSLSGWGNWGSSAGQRLRESSDCEFVTTPPPTPPHPYHASAHTELWFCGFLISTATETTSLNVKCTNGPGGRAETCGIFSPLSLQCQIVVKIRSAAASFMHVLLLLRLRYFWKSLKNSPFRPFKCI